MHRPNYVCTCVSVFVFFHACLPVCMFGYCLCSCGICMFEYLGVACACLGSCICLFVSVCHMLNYSTVIAFIHSVLYHVAVCHHDVIKRRYIHTVYAQTY